MMNFIDMKLLIPLLIRSTKKRPCSFLYGLSRNYSTQNAEKTEVATREKIQLTKPTPTRWKRPPFLKSFFFGKFDTELMAFPEILEKEQVIELEENVKVVSDLMKQKVNSTEIDQRGSIPKDILQDLKEMGLYGRSIPEKYGGLDLSYTAITRLNEALSLDWSICSTLAAHEFFATQPILKFGTEAQKSLYLPKLASGNYVGALCCSELGSGSDLWSMSTRVSETEDGDFLLNGIKNWVTNAGRADLFVVFARTENVLDPKTHHISAFLVEKNTKGVHVAPQDKICLRGLDTGTVTFDDVIIPKSNMIGTFGQGFEIYFKALESFRIAMNTFTFGALKAILDSVTDHVIQCERMESSLADYQLVRTRLSRINARIYAMESLSYFTAAILDSSENPSIELESAALKLFNSEGTLYCIRELMTVFGSSSQTVGAQLERFHRDAQGLALFDAPNDIVRLYISLLGFQAVGTKKAEEIMRKRNVFFFPWDSVKEFIRHLRIKTDTFKYDQDIAGYIHPSLVEWGNKLERNLNQCEVVVEGIFAEHGAHIVETQLDIAKMADIVADLFAWSAVLSRCSRSYCIGLKNSHHELQLACAFCHDAHDRVTENFRNIYLGICRNNERYHLLLGEQVVDCKGYFPEHPLKHNH